MVSCALSEFCRESGCGSDRAGISKSEIVIKEGDVVEEILLVAAEHSCDLVIMGACKGLISGTSLGDTIKTVLKKSRIPTLIVPSELA